MICRCRAKVLKKSELKLISVRIGGNKSDKQLSGIKILQTFTNTRGGF